MTAAAMDPAKKAMNAVAVALPRLLRGNGSCSPNGHVYGKRVEACENDDHRSLLRSTNMDKHHDRFFAMEPIDQINTKINFTKRREGLETHQTADCGGFDSSAGKNNKGSDREALEVAIPLSKNGDLKKKKVDANVEQRPPEKRTGFKNSMLRPRDNPHEGNTSQPLRVSTRALSVGPRARQVDESDNDRCEQGYDNSKTFMDSAYASSRVLDQLACCTDFDPDLCDGRSLDSLKSCSYTTEKEVGDDYSVLSSSNQPRYSRAAEYYANPANSSVHTGPISTKNATQLTARGNLVDEFRGAQHGLNTTSYKKVGLISAQIVPPLQNLGNGEDNLRPEFVRKDSSWKIESAKLVHKLPGAEHGLNTILSETLGRPRPVQLIPSLEHTRNGEDIFHSDPVPKDSSRKIELAELVDKLPRSQHRLCTTSSETVGVRSVQLIPPPKHTKNGEDNLRREPVSKDSSWKTELATLVEKLAGAEHGLNTTSAETTRLKSAQLIPHIEPTRNGKGNLRSEPLIKDGSQKIELAENGSCSSEKQGENAPKSSNTFAAEEKDKTEEPPPNLHPQKLLREESEFIASEEQDKEDGSVLSISTHSLGSCALPGSYPVGSYVYFNNFTEANVEIAESNDLCDYGSEHQRLNNCAGNAIVKGQNESHAKRNRADVDICTGSADNNSNKIDNINRERRSVREVISQQRRLEEMEEGSLEEDKNGNGDEYHSFKKIMWMGPDSCFKNSFPKRRNIIHSSSSSSELRRMKSPKKRCIYVKRCAIKAKSDKAKYDLCHLEIGVGERSHFPRLAKHDPSTLFLQETNGHHCRIPTKEVNQSRVSENADIYMKRVDATLKNIQYYMKQVDATLKSIQHQSPIRSAVTEDQQTPCSSIVSPVENANAISLIPREDVALDKIPAAPAGPKSTLVELGLRSSLWIPSLENECDLKDSNVQLELVTYTSRDTRRRVTSWNNAKECQVSSPTGVNEFLMAGNEISEHKLTVLEEPEDIDTAKCTDNSAVELRKKNESLPQKPHQLPPASEKTEFVPSDDWNGDNSSIISNSSQPFGSYTIHRDFSFENLGSFWEHAWAGKVTEANGEAVESRDLNDFGSKQRSAKRVKEQNASQAVETAYAKGIIECPDSDNKNPDTSAEEVIALTTVKEGHSGNEEDVSDKLQPFRSPGSEAEESHSSCFKIDRGWLALDHGNTSQRSSLGMESQCVNVPKKHHIQVNKCATGEGPSGKMAPKDSNVNPLSCLEASQPLLDFCTDWQLIVLGLFVFVVKHWMDNYLGVSVRLQNWRLALILIR